MTAVNLMLLIGCRLIGCILFHGFMGIGTLIGENVRAIRHKKGWSQADLSIESGLHRTYVSGNDRGTRNPTAEVIEVLAIALNVKPAALFANWVKPEEG